MINDINTYYLRFEKQIKVLESGSLNQQNQLITKIMQQPLGANILLNLLIYRRISNSQPLSNIDSILFKYLYHYYACEDQNKLNIYFQDGIVKLESSNNINYKPLYLALISNNFKKANTLTNLYLKKLAGLNKDNKRQWLYFTDITKFPIKDLKTINTLWEIYSEGQFGFTIQREIWLNHNKNWEKFWQTVGWKINKKNIRYPYEFTWDKSAPKGHLPLSNQLRGVQFLAQLFIHPALESIKK